MLSRLHSGKGAQNLFKCIGQVQIRCVLAEISSSAVQNQSGQRDLVNFPRPKKLEKSPETRLGFIPKSWFDFMYPKTGVTGPYMLGFGVGTYMLSKEIYVVGGETLAAIGFVLAIMIVHLKYGPKIYEIYDKTMTESEKEMNAGQELEKQNVRNEIAAYEKAKFQTEGVKYLSDAKRENVYLQMEAVYRERMSEAFAKVKRRLDYHVERNDLIRRYEQRNLSEWVIQNVMSSITAQQKKAALKQSIASLKALAAKP